MRPDGQSGAPPERERGAALLTVLMLVTVIAAMAGASLERLRIATRLAGNTEAIEAARGFARAAETLALQRIDDLLGQNPTRVTLAGGWSGRPFGLPLPGGGIAIARVADGGNCFNLNSLVFQTGPGVFATNVAARVQFARLMRLLNVPGQTAETIAASAADWIDSDGDQQAGGAEDGFYVAQAQPYRTAGTLMADPSELRAVNGVTPAIYATLRPYLCALPIARASPINVNTVSPEQAPLIAMQAPDTLTVSAAQQMLLRRPPDGYGSTNEFWRQAAASAITPENGEGQTAITTTWFKLDVRVTANGMALEQHGLIDATRLPAYLVSREWGEPS